MGYLSPTPLETALLDRFHALYGADGFPRTAAITVLARSNTEGGRCTALFSPNVVNAVGTHLDLGGTFIEMAGLPNGLMAVVRLDNGKIKELEIAVYGGHRWDGAEREWHLV